MITHLREQFNRSFTEDRYSSFVDELNTVVKYPTDFRISETPIFIPDDLTQRLISACGDILSILRTPEYTASSRRALPPTWNIPGEPGHPSFLQIDFAICRDENGQPVPKLIELQGFASLYCYQILLDRMIRKHFSIPASFTPYFSGLHETTYLAALRTLIVGRCNPENVILLEIHPEKQKTRIDFACTEQFLGVRTVCISDVKAKGTSLYYDRDGVETRIERIYNRVIFDELERTKITPGFELRGEYDVTWVGHPNWYFLISKFSLPFLACEHCPDTRFLSDLSRYPDDLSRYVLKPLFSFAGLGVQMDVTPSLLDGITARDQYVLQEKIEYAPVIETPDGYSKAEIRMMFLWDDEPVLVNNLVRMSKGKMMGVDFNKDKTWIGSSLAYHSEV